MPKAIFLTCKLDSLHEKAVELAEKLQIPLLDEMEIAGEQGILLILAEDGLSLRCLGEKMRPLRVDFTGGKNAFRLAENRTIRQPLARAAGISHGLRPSIFDATAGLGGDAFVFASLGCQVTMTERAPLVFALLEDGLRRAANHQQTAAIVARMRLLPGDARDTLPILNPPPDCVYLDPMYPKKKNSALPGKGMHILRQLIGGDDDSAELLGLAQAVAQRVVVKRPKGAPWLAAAKPSHAIAMPNSRFDVYLRPPPTA
jgi:16S rRNA (guanine1516-N2)-methyltransferase